MPRAAHLCLPLLTLATAMGPSAAAARDESCEVTGAERVVAIGDVHGAYAEFLAVLRMAGLVDEKGRWSGGKAHLVQTGDILDRGSETKQVMDLLMKLEGDAKKAGGRVHALMGNHEAMNVLGDLRYVSREEYKSFEQGRSRETRETFYESRRDAARLAAREAKQKFDEAAFRVQFEEDFPLGYVERALALAADGRYGRWLRERKPLVKIDGTLFLHGGLTPEVAELGCEKINATVKRELTSDVVKTRENPQATLAAGDAGPLWYRGMAREDEAAWTPSLERVLAGIGARRIVIGHTVTGDGRIKARFAGRVVMIDVGMNPLYGRNLAALELARGGEVGAAIYETGREELERAAAAAAAAP
jgi:hypothetical protein